MKDIVPVAIEAFMELKCLKATDQELLTMAEFRKDNPYWMKVINAELERRTKP